MFNFLRFSILFSVMMLASCGDSGSERGISSRQMGGAIQGGSLTTSGSFSVFAGQVAPGASDGRGESAEFNGPNGITTDGMNLYIADTGNNTIRKVEIATGTVTTFAGSTSSGSDDGIGPSARFNMPYGITTDGENLFVADTGNETIRKIVIATGVVTTLAGSAGLPGSRDGVGAAAGFIAPGGITTDGTNLYVSDTGNRAIRKVVIATGEVTTLAGESGTPGTTDGSGSNARFGTVFGITTDGVNLYVADTDNCTIRKIVISTGSVTTLAGRARVGGLVDGIGTAALFGAPFGVTTDGTSLFVTDWRSDVVRKITISTGAVTTLAGIEPSSPRGITTDGNTIFILSSHENTVYALQ